MRVVAALGESALPREFEGIIGYLLKPGRMAGIGPLAEAAAILAGRAGTWVIDVGAGTDVPQPAGARI
jgi:hypothetical protein